MLEDCSYFTTELVNVDGSFTLPLAARKSFTILIATRGNLEVVAPDGAVTPLPQGQTLLVPASMPTVTVRGNGE